MINKDVEVIAYLLNNKEKDINISGTANGLHLDYKSAHNIVKRLEENNVITLYSFGKSSKIHMNLSCNPLLYEAEYKRRQEILKNKDIKTILEYFERNIQSKFCVMLLFGSYVKKKQTKYSDIDLLFIIPDESMEKNIQQVASMIPIKLHINIFTEKEFIAMKNSKQITVGSEAIKNNIILLGIEQYYRLLQ
jgi:predicted nucleotidyltransferase